MRCLALDTATRACSAAVLEDDQVLAFEYEPMARGQSEALVPMVRRVMAAAGMDFGALDRIAVTRGPGAFTGVRIGLATARALALAAGVPVVGVGTLTAMAAAARHQGEDGQGEDGLVLAAIDSKRGDVFVQFFPSDDLEPTSPQACSPDEVSRLLDGQTVALVGDTEDLLLPVMGDRITILSEIQTADARFVGRLGLSLPPDATSADPMYLRPADATPARHGGRLRP